MHYASRNKRKVQVLTVTTLLGSCSSFSWCTLPCFVHQYPFKTDKTQSNRDQTWLSTENSCVGFIFPAFFGRMHPQKASDVISFLSGFRTSSLAKGSCAHSPGCQPVPATRETIRWFFPGETDGRAASLFGVPTYPMRSMVLVLPQKMEQNCWNDGKSLGDIQWIGWLKGNVGNLLEPTQWNMDLDGKNDSFLVKMIYKPWVVHIYVNWTGNCKVGHPSVSIYHKLLKGSESLCQL